MNQKNDLSDLIKTFAQVKQAQAQSDIAKEQERRNNLLDQYNRKKAEEDRKITEIENQRLQLEKNKAKNENNLRATKKAIIEYSNFFNNIKNIEQLTARDIFIIANKEMSFNSKKDEINRGIEHESSLSEIDLMSKRMQSIEDQIRLFNISKKYCIIKSFAVKLSEINKHLEVRKELLEQLEGYFNKIENTSEELILFYKRAGADNWQDTIAQEKFEDALNSSVELKNFKQSIVSIINIESIFVGFIFFGIFSAIFADFGYGWMVAIAATVSYFFLKGKIDSIAYKAIRKYKTIIIEHRKFKIHITKISELKNLNSNLKKNIAILKDDIDCFLNDECKEKLEESDYIYLKNMQLSFD